MSGNNQRAIEWYREAEEKRQQVIDNAVKTGAVIPAERLFEPHQRYELVTRKLSRESDRRQAFAMLDDLVKREAGVYHISLDHSKAWRNTDNTKLLKDMIYNRLSGILEATPKNKQALSFLEQWKAQPTPTQTLPIPVKIKTARAINAIERAIGAGMIESTSEGLKWRGIGSVGTQMQLAYFCKCAWCPRNTEVLPETAINSLFNVKRIGNYVGRLIDVKKPQKWRAQIDELFME